MASKTSSTITRIVIRRHLSIECSFPIWNILIEIPVVGDVDAAYCEAAAYIILHKLRYAEYNDSWQHDIIDCTVGRL